MLWWILGFVCIGLLCLAVIGLVLTARAERQRYQHVMAEGVSAIGWLVQANNILFQPGDSSAPAQVLLSFEGQRAADLDQLAEIARRIGRLKSAPPADALEEEVAKLVTDEAYRPTVRHRLPEEFTGGLEVHSAHVWIDRSLLPEGRITQPYIHCKAIPGDEGMVYMVPYPEDE